MPPGLQVDPDRCRIRLVSIHPLLLIVLLSLVHFLLHTNSIKQEARGDLMDDLMHR